MVSMPYDGLFSFLRKTFCSNWSTPGGVNALWRAFFISTDTVFVAAFTNIRCQCPMTGFFHFYGYAGMVAGSDRGVNALWRAFFISTIYNYIRSQADKCVNALWRAFFISTSKPQTPARIRQKRVNALWRAFFISTVRIRQQGFRRMGCQCPMTGFFHFYIDILWQGKVYLCGVNALWRAFFISILVTTSSRTLFHVCQCPMTGFFHFYAVVSPACGSDC